MLRIGIAQAFSAGNSPRRCPRSTRKLSNAAKDECPDLRPLRFAWSRFLMNRQRCMEVQPALRIEHQPAAGFVDDVLRLAANDAQIPVHKDEAAASELGQDVLVRTSATLRSCASGCTLLPSPSRNRRVS